MRETMKIEVEISFDGDHCDLCRFNYFYLERGTWCNLFHTKLSTDTKEAMLRAFRCVRCLRLPTERCPDEV